MSVEIYAKFGLREKETGREIILPKYDKIVELDDELMKVELDGKLGLINKSGK